MTETVPADSSPRPLDATVVAGLRAIRKTSGMSVGAVAQKCAGLGASHITESVLWNVESGRKRITLDMFLVLALALDVAPTSLLNPVASDVGPGLIAVTPSYVATAADTAAWMAGARPLSGVDAATYYASQAPADTHSDEPRDASLDARIEWAMRQVEARTAQAAANAAETIRDATQTFLSDLADHADASPEVGKAVEKLRSRLSGGQAP